MRFGKGGFVPSNVWLGAYIVTGNENFLNRSRFVSAPFGKNNELPLNTKDDPDRRGREQYFRQRDREQLKEFYAPGKRREFL